MNYKSVVEKKKNEMMGEIRQIRAAETNASAKGQRLKKKT